MIEHDTLLATDGVDLQLAYVDVNRQRTLWRIEFQFPPKIKEDTRDGDWQEDAGNLSMEALATYKRANPRKTTLEWTYIVGAGSTPNLNSVGGTRWTAGRIWNQLTTLRAYFSAPNLFLRVPPDWRTGSVVYLRIWGHGGVKLMSYRLASVNIKHGDAMVGRGTGAFHLRTDVSVQLRPWPALSFGDRDYQVVPGQTARFSDWF
jgi:hypothetical protein